MLRTPFFAAIVTASIAVAPILPVASRRAPSEPRPAVVRLPFVHDDPVDRDLCDGGCPDGRPAKGPDTDIDGGRAQQPRPLKGRR